MNVESLIKIAHRNANGADVNYDLTLYPEEDTCGYQRSVEDKRQYWQRIENVFGNQGMPSCGMTDAQILGGGSDDDSQNNTIYLGTK